MSGTLGDRIARLVISLVILAVLGLQGITAVGLTPGPIEKSPFLWPFLDYPMYSLPYFEGDAIPRHRTVGITEDGRELEINPETLGTDFWIYRDAFVFPLIHRSMRRDLGPGVELFESRHGVRLVEIRLEDRPLVLTPEGTVEGGVEVLGVARRLEASEPRRWDFE